MKFNVTKILNLAITPHGILIFSVAASFAAWVFPGFSFLRKGFAQRDSLLSFGALILLIFYLAMVVFSFLGYKIGARINLKTRALGQNLSLTNNFPYYVFTGLAALGFICFFTYIIRLLGVSGILNFIGQSKANEIKNALYEDYSIGVLSLRYLVILSGGIAIFRVLSGISRSVIDGINVLFLLLIALASSRLSVIVAAIIGVGLYVSYHKRIVISLWKVTMAIAGLFILLSGYNFTRNSNFYAGRGNDGFLDAGVSEIITYLGTPFQGALSAAGHLEEVVGGADADDIAGIETSLTTNSAFAALTSSLGYWSFVVLIGSAIVGSLLMGMTSSLRSTYLGLPYFVMLYGFSEIWRLYMFNRGIFITLFFFSLVVPAVILTLPSRLQMRRQRRLPG